MCRYNLLKQLFTRHTPAGAQVGNTIASAVNIKVRGHGPPTNADLNIAFDAIGKDLAKSKLTPPREAQAVARSRARETFDALPKSLLKDFEIPQA
jgi:hypothetical protein